MLPRNIGVITLEDSETGETVELDTSNRAVVDEYEKINKTRLKKFRLELAKSKIDLLEARTDKPFITTLRKFFDSRSKR